MKNEAISAAFSHELMRTVVEALYPDLVCGQHYMIGHPIDPDTDRQGGAPFFAYWRADVPQPEVATLQEKFTTNEAEYRATFARKYRNACLEWSDAKAAMPDDLPPTLRAKKEAWKTYRQALRDVPQQAGFPLDIDWPEMPS